MWVSLFHSMVCGQSEMRNVTWAEVLVRLKKAQRDYKMNIRKQDLTELGNIMYIYTCLHVPQHCYYVYMYRITGYLCDPEICAFWPKNGNLWILFMRGSKYHARINSYLWIFIYAWHHARINNRILYMYIVHVQFWHIQVVSILRRRERDVCVFIFSLSLQTSTTVF